MLVLSPYTTNYFHLSFTNRLAGWCESRIRAPNGFDLLRQLFTYDPLTRLTAAEALQHKWFTEDPRPSWNAFAGISPHQIPPHRRITQDDAPSMMPVPARDTASQHQHAGPVQFGGSKPGSTTSFASLSGGHYGGAGGSGGRKKARLG